MTNKRHNFNIPVRERIIIHLGEFKGYKNKFPITEDITQPGIKKAINIRLEHVSRALKDLIAEDLVYTKSTIIKNHIKRKKAYFLTRKGHRYLKELKLWLNTKWIHIRLLNKELREIQYYELEKFSNKQLNPLEVYKYVAESKNNIIDLNKVH